MYSLHLKTRLSHIHPIPMHTITAKAKHLMYDRRFWGVVALVAFVAVLVVFAIWAASAGTGEAPDMSPYFPF